MSITVAEIKPQLKPSKFQPLVWNNGWGRYRSTHLSWHHISIISDLVFLIFMYIWQGWSVSVSF